MGRQRSKALMDSLYDLRRAGHPTLGQQKRPQSPPAEQAFTPHPGCTACPELHERRPTVPKREEAPAVEEEDPTLMEMTIADCQDSPEQLERCIDILLSAQHPVGELGGTRHATSCVSMRTLAVAQRKLEVLTPVAMAIAEMEVLNTRKEQIIQRVIAGAVAEEVLGDALGIRSKVLSSIHPGGRPQDADRTVFQSFVTTFKLPGQHGYVLRGKHLLQTETPIWGDLMARFAREQVEQERERADESGNSPAAEAVKRLVAVGLGMGLTWDDAKLHETELLSKAAKAAALLRNAQFEVRKDARAAAAHDNGDSAQLGATRIEANVKAAQQWGLEKSHPDVIRTLTIAKDLRADGVHRYALDQMRKKKDGPGEAEKTADRVDEAIRKVVKLGVNPAHDKVQAAQKLALAAREEEGIRKRLANAEKRKADAAAAAEAKAAKEAAKEAAKAAAAEQADA